MKPEFSPASSASPANSNGDNCAGSLLQYTLKKISVAIKKNTMADIFPKPRDTILFILFHILDTHNKPFQPS
jgi:hypothetical protein